jgi:glycosyltransferase involved in cell wall biosynthesis
MLISVIIPIHNRQEELKRAITSVINQTFKNWELLIVDDCSDQDIEVVTELFKDSRIRYFRINKKTNANVCRNKGIKESKGEYIAMLDSDDEWLPEHLEKSLDCLINLNADGIFSSYKVFDGENYSFNIIRPLRNGEQMANYILDGNSTATPTHFYKTICAKNTLWDEELERHQDYDFSIRFADKYSFIPMQLFSVIVNWRKNEKRYEHLPSQIRFLEKHKSRLSKKMYVKYNREVLSGLMKRKVVELYIIKYFQKNLFENIKELSLTDFMSIYDSENTKFKKTLLRINFIIKVLFS